MIKYLLIAPLTIFSAFYSQGQKPAYSISVQSYLGYEVNMFKSPYKFSTEDGTELTRSDLWKNAPFTGGCIRYIAHGKDKAH